VHVEVGIIHQEKGLFAILKKSLKFELLDQIKITIKRDR